LDCHFSSDNSLEVKYILSAIDDSIFLKIESTHF